MSKKVFAKKDKRTELEKERDEAVKLLRSETPGTDGYTARLEAVERLDKLISAESARKSHVDPNAVLAGAVGLLQVGAILGKERIYNVTSKALPFVFKGRVR